MTHSVLPHHDPRSVDELVNIALTELDEKVAWDAACLCIGKALRKCSNEPDCSAEVIARRNVA